MPEVLSLGFGGSREAGTRLWSDTRCCCWLWRSLPNYKTAARGIHSGMCVVQQCMALPSSIPALHNLRQGDRMHAIQCKRSCSGSRLAVNDKHRCSAILGSTALKATANELLAHGKSRIKHIPQSITQPPVCSCCCLQHGGAVCIGTGSTRKYTIAITTDPRPL